MPLVLQVEENLLLSGGQYYYGHSLAIADGPCLHLFGLPACYKTNVVLRDFSDSTTTYIYV